MGDVGSGSWEVLAKGNSLLGWQQGLAWLEIVGSREGYECIHPFILPSIPIHSLFSLGYKQWAKWNPFVHSGSTGALTNEDLSLDHLGSINLSRSYEGTNSFSGQSSPIHAMGWQELLSKMQSTVAPPLAYAWLPRFIFLNPLPAHLPGPWLKFARKSSNPRNEKILNRSCSVLQAAAFILWFIIFWNMQQMGPI